VVPFTLSQESDTNDSDASIEDRDCCNHRKRFMSTRSRGHKSDPILIEFAGPEFGTRTDVVNGLEDVPNLAV